MDVNNTELEQTIRDHELYESRGGRPWLPVPNNPYGLRGRTAALNLNKRTRCFLYFVCFQFNEQEVFLAVVTVLTRHECLKDTMMPTRLTKTTSTTMTVMVTAIAVLLQGGKSGDRGEKHGDHQVQLPRQRQIRRPLARRQLQLLDTAPSVHHWSVRVSESVSELVSA